MTTMRTPSDAACMCGSFGLLLVCTYPGLGSALAWELGLSGMPSRRILQAAMLLLGLIGMVIAARRHSLAPSRGLVIRGLTVAALGAIVPLISAVPRGVWPTSDCMPSLTRLAALALGVSWSAAAMIWVLAVAWPRFIPPASTPGWPCRESRFQRILAACGALLSLQVWILGAGHEDGSVHLSMGASQSFLVVLFLSVAGLVVWRRGIVGVLSAIPWIYLSILTTSRLAMLLIPLMACVVPMASHLPRHGPWRWTDRQLVLGPLFVSIALTFSIAPVSLFGVPLPYRESAGNVAHAHEWAARMGRVGRIVFAAAGTALPGTTASAPYSDQPPGWQKAAYSSQVPDDRLQMWRVSLTEIVNTPLGAWPCPVRLKTEVRLPDGDVMSHLYASPHNVFLELGMTFGWAAGVVALLGCAALAWMAMRVIATTNDMVAACAAVGCLVELTRAQFSGDLRDGLGLLVAGCIVTFAYRTGSVVASDSCRSNVVAGP